MADSVIAASSCGNELKKYERLGYEDTEILTVLFPAPVGPITLHLRKKMRAGLTKDC